MSTNNYLYKPRYILWKIEETIWKIFNKVFRTNFYNPIYKPKWLSLKLYLFIQKLYEKRVQEPYAKMVQEKIIEDLSKNPKLQKFKQYFRI